MNARVALIGAPGAGKTTIGSALAELRGCTFIDTDVEFQGDYGMSVAEAVIDDEATFRAREQEVVVRSLAVLGTVVAVGGGDEDEIDVGEGCGHRGIAANAHSGADHDGTPVLAGVAGVMR